MGDMKNVVEWKFFDPIHPWYRTAIGARCQAQLNPRITGFNINKNIYRGAMFHYHVGLPEGTNEKNFVFFFPIP